MFECKLEELYENDIVNPCILHLIGCGAGALLIFSSMFTVQRVAMQSKRSSLDYFVYLLCFVNVVLIVIEWAVCRDSFDFMEQISNIVMLFTWMFTFVLHFFMQSKYFQHYSWQLLGTIFIYTAIYFFLARNEKKREDSDDTLALLYEIQFGVNCVLLFSSTCFGRLEGDPEVQVADFNYFRIDDDERAEIPKLGIEDRSGWLSRLTFWWMNGLFATGYKRQLDFDDLKPYFSPNYDCNQKYKQFKKHWDKQTGKKNVLSACIKGFGWAYACNGFLKIFYDCCQFVNPIILNKLLTFIEDDKSDATEGYMYCLILLGAGLIGTLILQAYWHVGFRFGMDIRSALACALYHKTLLMSPTARASMESGQIMNLVTTDCQKIRNLFPYLWMLVSAPFQAAICCYLLYKQVGYSIFIGMGISCIVVMPANLLFTRKVRKFQKERLGIKDQRLSIMNEILGAMKVLKLYTWEPAYEEKVHGLREREVQQLKSIVFWGSLSSFCWTIIPIFLMVITLISYVWLGGTLNPAKAFTTIVLVNMLRFPLAILPMMIVWFAEAGISLNRIQNYLEQDELPADNVKIGTGDPNVMYKMGKPEQDAEFYWGSDMETRALSKLNYNIRRGELVMVVGKIGAGKSAFLKSLIGELACDHAVTYFRASQATVAYTDQVPWIQNMTLRKNILFGQHYDMQWYQEVIYACAMIPDFNQLSAADKTEIGEKGINLSGGQKQRVALARALYQNAEIYLLDDPLSAVDVHVAGHMMEECILGVLKEKTVVLCTNALRYLIHADKIIVLENGEMKECGTYDELSNKGINFENYIVTEEERAEEEAAKSPNPEEDEEEEGSKTPKMKPSKINIGTSPSPMTRNDSFSKDNDWDDAEAAVEALREEVEDPSVWDPHDDDLLINPKLMLINEADMDIKELEKKKKINAGQLTEEEGRKRGSVGWKIYCQYLAAIGGWTIFGPYAFFRIANAVAMIGADRWMAFWATGDGGHSENYYLTGYCIIACLPILLFGFATLLKAIAMLKSARSMHHSMLGSVLRAPMEFHDTTPRGRITNRFSSDQSSVDETLPYAFDSFFRVFSSIFCTFILIISVVPAFAGALVPLCIIYFFSCTYYLSSSREIKRWQQTLNSPIFGLFSETIDGVSTIRAFNNQQKFIDLNYNRINRDHVAYFVGICSNRWLAVRLEMVGSLIIFSATLFAVIERDNISPGLMGLAVSYSMTITQSLNWLVRMASDVENNIVSVERIQEYIDLTPEAPWNIKETVPYMSWPEVGCVEFNNIKLRYREGLDLVLKGVSLKIAGGEKVGIVGRTGSGKSSLFVALMRLVELAEGDIKIDDVDISQLGVHDLRSKIAIIPQDPVMFQGTLRTNVDPVGHFDGREKEIHTALEQSHFTSTVDERGLDLLDLEVKEGGSNFSVGQRQLMCLTRALLKNANILMLDEATSQVDPATDALIQKTLREEFKHATVLTIAHRINTILDYDKVLVMEDGVNKEFDDPEVLRNKKHSLFADLVNKEKSEEKKRR